jgi:DNA polymerase/3'-5' exonuclease PolX
MSSRSNHKAVRSYIKKKNQIKIDSDAAKMARTKLNLTPTQHVMLSYHDDLSKIIPRTEIKKHVDFVKNYIPNMIPAGSYRRNLKKSSDIDIIVRESLSTIVDMLTNAGYIKAVISSGKRRFSGVVILPDTKIHRQIDIIFTTPREYPFALLYFTGSKKNNILMRLKAKQKGFKLNQYGLWRGLDLVPGLTTERDIFKKLDMPYLNPEDR